MEENTALNQNETAYFIPFHWSHNGLKSLMKLHWFYSQKTLTPSILPEIESLENFLENWAVSFDKSS